MLQNASLLAIVAVDTAENEPSEVCDAVAVKPFVLGAAFGGTDRCAALNCPGIAT